MTVLVGIGRPDGLGQAEPVRIYRDLDDCLDELSAHTADVRRAAADHRLATRAELRIGAAMGDVGPVLVLCAAEPQADQLERLVELAADRASGLAGVMAAADRDGPWALEISEGLMEVGPLARRVVPQRLSGRVLATMEASLATAASEPSRCRPGPHPGRSTTGSLPPVATT